MRSPAAVVFLTLALHCAFATAANAPFSKEQLDYLDRRDAENEAKWWSHLREAYARDPQQVLAQLEGTQPSPAKGTVPAPETQRDVSVVVAPSASDPPPLGTVPEDREFVVSRNVKTPQGGDGATLTELSVTGPIGQPTADRNVRGASSLVQIDGSAGGTTGTVVLSLPRTQQWVGDSLHTYQWAVTASTAVDNKDEGSATFATLDGPANGSSLGFDFTYTTTKRNDGAMAMADLCHLRGYKLVTCVDDFDDHVPEALGPSRDEYLAALDKLQASAHWGLIYNIHGAVLHNDYTYFGFPTADAAAPKHVVGKTGWKLGAEFGGTTPSRNAFLGGGFDFVHGYKEDKDRVVCPETDAATFDCQSGKFNPPADKVGRQLYLEARSVAFNNMAYSLRVSHDLATDKNAADLPIFLFGSKDAAFTGGLRLGWTTDAHFLAGIFVGKPFDLLPTH
jgi:hypothetical protein